MMHGPTRIVLLLLGLAACGDDGSGGGGAAIPDASAAPSTVATATSGSTAGAGGAAFEHTRLMTWNLEDFPKSSATISAIKEITDAHAPDVVALQELSDQADFDALLGALPGYTGLLAMSGDGFVRVGALYRPDRVDLADAQMVFTEDDYAFPRPMLAFRVTPVDRPEQDFALGIVHLKAQLDAESTDRRRQACIRLDQWVPIAQATLDEDVVIAGDFNDQLLDPQQWNVFGPLLSSPDGGFLTRPLEEAGAYTYIPFESFIDHVLVRSDRLFPQSSAEVLELDLTEPGYEAAVSDHRPVVATLRFPR